MGHPGTLPVINREAVKHVLKMGAALGGELADYTEFDRKSYFYPDLPKGYQISQYKHPLVKGGTLNGVALTRIHLEEDTARSVHDTGEQSLIDFNRSGIPLMELVTEPVIESAKAASDFAKELQLLLRYLGAGEANMEKGEMRVEANVSVSPGAEKGTKVEVKNLNSFRAVERAIEYEVKRQSDMLKRGERVVQETRGWDESKQETFSQRVKEESHDYRYMPDPDLPKLYISELPRMHKEVLRKELPELPWEKRKRYAHDIGIKETDIELFVRNKVYERLLEGHVIPAFSKDKETFALAVNYIVSDVVGLTSRLGENAKELGVNFVNMVKMLKKGEISSRGAKDILHILLRDGGDPMTIATKQSLLQESGHDKLLILVDGIIKEHPEAIREYKNGKESALHYLVGQAMKKSKGSANPQLLSKLIQEKISS
ncbi:Asp-tRNA(Asn)/Glu-tRNA(Gln) amidotransferase subunit GatB [Candidatus Kaiserbacteria bacterium]|nr:Asp-tRNA(Asn)/Glu-tRNA(Gln) amidotransferase subunit GatB [Candidatus Kaiserbacteria bacterium]